MTSLIVDSNMINEPIIFVNSILSYCIIKDCSNTIEAKLQQWFLNFFPYDCWINESCRPLLTKSYT